MFLNKKNILNYHNYRLPQSSLENMVLALTFLLAKDQ
jgi:hypothetical protein